MTGYTDVIHKYAADDRRVGILDDADGTGEVGLNTGETGKRLAVRFTLRCRDNRIDAIRFQVFGCGFTIAACGAAAQLAEGRPLEEALSINPTTVDTALGGLPHERNYCAELAVEALHAAVQSVRNGDPVQVSVQPPDEGEHAHRISAENLVYHALVDSSAPSGISNEDRHLLACLLAVAARESNDIAAALGLNSIDLAAILAIWFPDFNPSLLTRPDLSAAGEPAPEINNEVLAFLLDHVPTDRYGQPVPASQWLARILAARAAHPGHLWIAMGLFKRPELTAAIRRHFPSLAVANHQGMRWKRYLFKQVSDLNGGMMCKSPNCGVCSDYTLCFGPG